MAYTWDTRKNKFQGEYRLQFRCWFSNYLYNTGTKVIVENTKVHNQPVNLENT
eukprot:Pgem_evm1s12896